MQTGVPHTMKTSRLASHQQRVLLLGASAVILTALLTGIFAYLDFLEYARNDLRDNIKAAVLSYRAVLQGHIDEHSAALRNLAESPRVKGVYHDPERYETDVFETLNRLQRTHADASTAILAYEDGRYYESDPIVSFGEGYDPRERPWYRQGVALKAGECWLTDTFVRADDETIGAMLVTPITDDRGQVVGVAGILLNAEYLEDISRTQNHGSSIKAFVTQGEDIFIGPDPSQTGKPIPNEQIRTLAQTATPIKTTLIDCNAKYFAEAIYMPQVGLMVWVVGSESQLLANFWSSITEISLAAAVAVLLVLFVMGFVMKRMNREIDQLVRVANYFADGDLTVRAPVSTSTEFRDLARSMNLMASTIGNREAELERTIRQLKSANEDIILMLSNAIEASDAYTQGHCDRVVHYALLLGKALGFDDEQLGRLRITGLVHDVGKIGVPCEILNKPSRLTDDEWELMKAHPEIGARILRDSASLADVADVVLEHHERWDGSGYPRGLSGEAIALKARILAIADAYDAMVVARPYRTTPLTTEQAVEALRAGSGVQFDPELVERFIDLIEDEVPCGMPEADC